MAEVNSLSPPLEDRPFNQDHALVELAFIGNLKGTRCWGLKTKWKE